MAITLNDLLSTAYLRLGLVVRGAPGALDEPISWVHPTELDDPTPYLQGGEIILVSGVAMEKDAPSPSQRGYSQRLADRQVCGLGFGVDVIRSQPPEWLVRQCEASGLPLFVVPLDTPFAAVSKVISRGILDDQGRGFAARYNEQQQLLRAIQTLNPVSSIIDCLSQVIGGWASLLNPAGTVVESSHPFIPVDLGMLGEAITFSAVGQARFMNVKGYDVAVFHVTAPAGETLGFLVAGCRGATGALDHSLVASASLLLSLAVTPVADADRSLGRLRSSMIRACLEGDAQSVRPYAGDLWNDVPAEPLAVLRVVGERDALESAERLVEPFHRSLAKNLHPVLFGVVEGDLWIIVSQSTAGVWLGQFDRDSRLSIGCSSGCIWKDLPRARHEAYQACSEAMVSDEHLVIYGKERGVGALESIVDPARIRAFADLRLAPISTLRFNSSTGPHTSSVGGSASGAIIQATDLLSCWLEHRGNSEATGAAFGLHRHTVGKYLSRISAALSADLDDPAVRAELWYACRFTRFGSHPHAGGAMGVEDGS
ncbi:PucR family transcriptional regulator [uncultured Bifidobacterium sp.]|uniref:PucR family transcriptional regulator n=1 Tax=uncultured Bifidobacterium sp. TaxID=165187 RepID=UPI002628E08C|nr:PucR family transcriptional regulator [uncultured Bifidobacterium sp.]